MRKTDWTEEDSKLLEKLTYERKTNKVISVIMGKSESYICNKKKELGMEMQGAQRWSNEDVDILVVELGEGNDYENIAKLLDRTVTAVYVKAKMLGLSPAIEWKENYICNYFINQLKEAKSIQEAKEKSKLRENTIIKMLRYCKDKKDIISTEEYRKLLLKMTASRKVVRM